MTTYLVTVLVKSEIQVEADSVNQACVEAEGVALCEAYNVSAEVVSVAQMGYDAQGRIGLIDVDMKGI